MALEYELFTLDYEKSVEMAQGLKTITEHVKQMVYIVIYMYIIMMA